MSDVIDLTLWEPGYTSDPYPYLARLQDGQSAHRALFEGLPVWLVAGYENVRSALNNPALSNDPHNAGDHLPRVPLLGANLSPVAHHMLRRDAPDHTRLRALVSKGFTVRRIEALRPRIVQVAADLVASFAGRDQVDLVAEYAMPLPLTVISELFGVAPGDLDEFGRWLNVYAGHNEGDTALMPVAMQHLHQEIVKIIDERERERAGADPAGGTLIDVLLAARDGGDRLSHDELVSMALLILLAGYETTANLIGNGMFLLLSDPDRLAALRRDPALVATAIEEFLRYEAPVKTAASIRFALKEMTIGDTAIPKGDAVLLHIGATGRDPARWNAPDDFDVRRGDAGHLAFGHGIHYCIGAPLGRLEARDSIIERWVRTCRRELLDRTLVWNESHLHRCLYEFEVHYNEHRPHQAMCQAAPPRAVLPRSPIPGVSPDWTFAATTGSAVSSTNTNMPPELHGRDFRQAQG